MSPHVINGHTHNNGLFKRVVQPSSTTNNNNNGITTSSRGKLSHSHHDGFSTRAIHVGSEPSLDSNAVIPPISLSTTYKQDGIGNHKGFEYSRSLNPNRDAFERMIAALEEGPRSDKGVSHINGLSNGTNGTSSNGEAFSHVSTTTTTRGFAFASGSAATATILQALGPDSHVLCINDVYGGTYRYLERVASALTNLSTTFIDFEHASDEEILSSIRPNTKVYVI